MSVQGLAELVRDRQPCVVLTGAGISTESGIPDFRSAGGIWERYDPAEVAHVDVFRSDPARVWLHQRAGVRDVVEVHGSLREAECVHCRVGVRIEDADGSLPLPPCPECGEILKPGVVMFGEMLPVDAIERAQALAAGAELLLVVGSTLEVHPVAGLPGETLASGGALAIVNQGSTPWDSRAELVLDAGAGETLRALGSALDIVATESPRRSNG